MGIKIGIEIENGIWVWDGEWGEDVSRETF